MKNILLSLPNTRYPRNVVKNFEREIQDDTTPLISRFTTWRNLVTLLNSIEDCLFEEETEELKAIYRPILTTALALGQWLALEPGIENIFLDLHYTKPDFEAKLNVLRDSESLWYTQPDAAKSEAILNQVFCG